MNAGRTHLLNTNFISHVPKLGYRAHAYKRDNIEILCVWILGEYDCLIRMLACSKAKI